MVSKKIISFLAFLALSLLAGCTSPPADLDVSPRRHTANHHYVVDIHPVGGPADLNKIHPWEVHVTSPAGEPVDGLKIAVDGGMPQHGHGLPTRPRVTRQLGEGRYLVEGMKFSMTGWWEIKLKIDGAAASDTVTFNTIVDGRAGRLAGR
jgi:hypothetical protein